MPGEAAVLVDQARREISSKTAHLRPRNAESRLKALLQHVQRVRIQVGRVARGFGAGRTGGEVV